MPGKQARYCCMPGKQAGQVLLHASQVLLQPGKQTGQVLLQPGKQTGQVLLQPGKQAGQVLLQPGKQAGTATSRQARYCYMSHVILGQGGWHGIACNKVAPPPPPGPGHHPSSTPQNPESPRR